MDCVMNHEFEYDWCLSALDKLNKQWEMAAGTRWLVCGRRLDAFFEAVVRFLHFADQRLSLGLSLTVLTGEEELSAARQAFPFAGVENIDALREPVEAEFCLYIGYTTDGGAPDLRERSRAEKFWLETAKATRRALCITGSVVYGPHFWPAAAAEGEFRQGPVTPEGGFAREVEALALKNRSDAVLLRPGAVLAPGLALRSPVTELLDRLIRGESPCRFHAQTRWTLVYMTDLLTALIQTAVTPDLAGACNVGSAQTTASLLQICELFFRTGEGAPALKLELEGAEKCPDHALSCGKLESLGWKPEVDLPTMIALETAARQGRYEGVWLTGGHDGKLDIIHRELLKILTEIDRICKKHHIRYFLAGGTLLGAARHQGFIPWDDDLDIMMLREDHDRFLAVAEKELPEHLFLQTPQTDPGCHYLISKVRLSGTVFSSEFLSRFPELHKGLFVDVIAQDYTANSSLGQKLHLKLALLARGLVFKKWSGQSAASVKKRYAAFDAAIRLLPMPLLERFQRWALTLLNKKPGRRYLYDSMGINISRGVYPAQWLSGQVEIPFEGGRFPAPVEYGQYLNYLYGAYMQPVPVTRRRDAHTVTQLDLGPYADPNTRQETERRLSPLGEY